MQFQISWRAYLRVKTESKAIKLLKQFEKSIEQKLVDIKLTPYWKDKALIEAMFITNYEEELEIEYAVFDTLQRINEVSHNWLITKPQNIGNEEIVWSFEGTSNGSRITGIEWMMFILSTNTKKEYGWNH